MGRRSLIERVRPLIHMGQQAGEAFDNAVAMVHQAGGISTQTPGTAAAPALACVAAVALRAKYSGIFRVDLSVVWADSVTADTVSHELVAIPVAGAWNPLVNATLPAGLFVGQDVPEGAGWNQLKNGGVLHVDAQGVAAAGLEADIGGVNTPINDAAPSAVVAQLSNDGTLTGLLTPNGAGTQKFSFSGLVMNTLANPSPLKFPIGDVIVFGVAMKALHGVAGGPGVITYGDLSMSVQEMPFR